MQISAINLKPSLILMPAKPYFIGQNRASVPMPGKCMHYKKTDGELENGKLPAYFAEIIKITYNKIDRHVSASFCKFPAGQRKK